MKKLSLLKLEELARSMPVLDETDQRNVVGGAGSPPPGAATGTYTFEQMEAMIDNGTWSGGIVSGMGYVLPSSIATGAYTPPPTGYRDWENENDPMRPSGSTDVWQNPYNSPPNGGGGGSNGNSPSSPPPELIFKDKEFDFDSLLEWYKYVHDGNRNATLYDIIGNKQTAIDNGFQNYFEGSNGQNLRKSFTWNSNTVDIVINDSIGGSYTEDVKGFNNLEYITAKNEGTETNPVYVIEMRNGNAAVIRIRCWDKSTYLKLINIVGL